MNLQYIFDKIDNVNRNDPSQTIWEGTSYPKEWLYGKRMTEWLMKVEPHASIALQIAARGQHVGRWEIKRGDYPMDRMGYLRWRTDLKKLHAEKLEDILIGQGVDRELVDRVKFLVQKKKLKLDPETQLLEDVICLVFLNYYFEDFKGAHSEEKIISIVSKTWKKMSNMGHQHALTMDYTKSSLELIQRAIAE